MISSDEIIELVLDTLYNRKKVGNSCLVSNESGQKLLDSDSNVIPAIEAAIRDTVRPKMEQHVEKHGFLDPHSMFREGPPFGGLDHLLGVYWVQNARTEPSHAVRFMQEMPWSVAGESILSLVNFFNPRRSLSGIPLPKQYIEYLYSLRDSGVAELERTAKYALKKLVLENARS